MDPTTNPMPDLPTAAAPAADSTNDDLVTKLNGPLDKFITQIESSDDADKITNDIPGFLKIFRQTLVESDPTRAGLFKICMEPRQTVRFAMPRLSKVQSTQRRMAN